MENNTGHLYLEQVAERIGVTESTFRSMRKCGNAPAPLGRADGRLIWEESTVETWNADRATGRTRTTCIVDGCTRVGWQRRGNRCAEHARRHDVLGHDIPGALPRRPRGRDVANLIASRSIDDPTTGCRLWVGATNGSSPYGRLQIKGRMAYAHRVAWELEHGPIAAEMTVDHRCARPICVNTTHMQLVDRPTNTRLMVERLRAQKAAAAAALVRPVPSLREAAAVAHLPSSVPVADVLALALGEPDRTLLEAYGAAAAEHLPAAA